MVSSRGIDPVSLLSFNRLQKEVYKLECLNFNPQETNQLHYLISTTILYSQKSKRLQVGKGLGYLPLEFVSIEIHAYEFSQIAQLLGDFPYYVIFVKLPAVSVKISLFIITSISYEDTRTINHAQLQQVQH